MWPQLIGVSAILPEPEIRAETMIHWFFHGNNARELIEIPADQLPPNVTFSLRQDGTSYVLHFMSVLSSPFNSNDVLDIDSVYAMLIYNDFIERHIAVDPD